MAVIRYILNGIYAFASMIVGRRGAESTAASERIERALSAIAACAVPLAMEPTQLDPMTESASLAARSAAGLSALTVRRRRPSLLAAQLLSVARMNVPTGHKASTRVRSALPPRPAIATKRAAKRSPTLVAIKRQPVIAKRPKTRIIADKPTPPSAVVIRFTPCAARPIGQRLKKAA